LVRITSFFNTGLKLGIGGCPLLVQRLQLD
jgi:hypothetical protein